MKVTISNQYHSTATRTNALKTKTVLPGLLVILISCLPALVFADELKLQILERGTGYPVADANVVLIDTQTVISSDEQGLTRADDVKLPLKIRILAAGFETLNTAISISNQLNTIYLTPISIEASELEVVAQRLPEKASKISLKAREIAQVAGGQGDPLIAIQSLPGIVTVDDGNGQVYMRGSDQHDNIVLVDDIPISYLYHFGGLRSTINPLLISDINLFLGGFPVSHGDALGGAFDVKLRNPNMKHSRNWISVSTIESSFVTEGPIKSTAAKDGYFLAARRSYIDLILSPSEFNDAFSDEDKDETEQDQIIAVPSFYDIQGMYHRENGQETFNAYLLAAGDKMKLEVREGTQADPELGGNLLTNTKYETLGVKWLRPLSDKWQLNMPLSLYHEQERFELGTDSSSGEPYYVDTEGLSLVWHPKLLWRATENQDITFGLDSSRFAFPIDLYISRPPLEQDPYFNLTDLPKKRVNETIKGKSLAPYVQQRYRWTPELTSILGLRYSYIDATGGIKLEDFSPRLALEYQATDDLLLTANWGRYIQLPLGFELLDGFGNPNLDYTEAEHRILGMQYKLDPQWELKIEAYHKPMEALVYAVDDQAEPDNYQNSSSGEAYGVDVFIKRQSTENHVAWISYSYAKSNRVDEGVERSFSGDQPHTLNIVWSQPFSGSWRDWNWGIKFVAHSGSLYTPVIGQDTTTAPGRTLPQLGSFNSKRTPNYYRLDVRLEKKLLNTESKTKVFLDIINATNHKNVTSFDYNEDYSNFNNPDEVTGLPFFPYIGFEMEF